MIRLISCVAVGIGSLAYCADWPQWRGPNRDGVSQETGLLQEWPKEGPKLLWQMKDLGEGYSTPAVVGDRIYVLSNKGMNDESLEARDVKDGKRLWATRLGKVGPNQGPQYPAARSTPTVDGDKVYALGSDGDLVCVQKADGVEIWRKNLRKDFGGQPGKWAYSESVLVDGDAVICTPGGKKATLVALKKATGEVLWTSAVPGGDQAGYASVIAVESGEPKQYVQFMENGLVGVDAKTGKYLWRYNKTGNTPANMATPVVHDRYVYTSGGKTGFGGLVQLKNVQNKVEADQVYYERGLPTSIGGSVVVGGFLYGTNQEGLVCAEFATGKVKWSNPCVGPGSICYADGRLYVHGEKSGEIALVAATPEKYEEKGRFTPVAQPNRGKSKAWAYPVVAEGRFYVRDWTSLWCYDVKASQNK